MGSRVKVMILSNTDPTSSAIFRSICEDPRLEVVAVAFTRTLTKSATFWGGIYDIFRASGFPYFVYILFWNGVFISKEWLICKIPLLRGVFPEFFSLKFWARNHNIQVYYSDDFSSSEFMAQVLRHDPHVLFTRINQILKEPLLSSVPYGCWCFHSSELPKYQGIAAEFHSLVNEEKTVGFTVMLMTTELDAGLIISQGRFLIPKSVTLHRLIELNNTHATRVIQQAVNKLVTNRLKYKQQDSTRGSSYFSWPNTEQTRAFRRKGLRYISVKETLAYIVK